MNEGLSERKAYVQMRISRGPLHRAPGPDKDAELRDKLRAVWRPNMGYRRAHSLVRREFEPLNVKRVHRIWKEEKLGRMKRYRKKRTGNPTYIWTLINADVALGFYA